MPKMVKHPIEDEEGLESTNLDPVSLVTGKFASSNFARAISEVLDLIKRDKPMSEEEKLMKEESDLWGGGMESSVKEELKYDPKTDKMVPSGKKWWKR